MNLFINSFTHSDPVRNAELVQCQAINRSNPSLKRIIDLRGRPTFREFFRELRRYPDDVNIIANLDVYLTSTIGRAAAIGRLECFALTRYEENADRSLRHYGHSDSQDAWIFRGGPRDSDEFEFHQGVPDCDGRLAYLLRRQGYTVTNPSGASGPEHGIVIVHFHHSQVRDYLLKGRGSPRGAEKRVRLGPPRAPVAICDL